MHQNDNVYLVHQNNFVNMAMVDRREQPALAVWQSKRLDLNLVLVVLMPWVPIVTGKGTTIQQDMFTKDEANISEITIDTRNQ